MPPVLLHFDEKALKSVARLSDLRWAPLRLALPLFFAFALHFMITRSGGEVSLTFLACILLVLTNTAELCWRDQKIITTNLERWSAPDTTLTLTDRNFKIESSTRTSVAQWDEVNKLSRHKNYWNLHLTDNHTVHVIPTSQIPESHLNFIQARVQATGGEIN